jgi:ABC-type multidrug transport system ATPase subunit
MNGPAPATLLRVQRLSFSYPQRHVFNAWSHDFPAGLTWVRGGNGCGKSTLLKLLAGALKPLSGTIEVQGVSQQDQPRDYRLRVFWCGPGAIAFDHLSPAEFFGFMRGLYASVDVPALQRHVAGLGLSPFMDAAMRTLSTGTQRKVWLAMALAAGTPVTLLDEPLNALDAASSAYFRASLHTLAQDSSRAWVVASHEALDDTPAAISRLDLKTTD